MTPANPSPRFLFLQYERPLGAAIHATALLEAVRLRFPDATIVVACGAMAADVLARNPFIDRLIRTADPIENLPRAAGDFVRRVALTQAAFDAVVTDCSNSRTPIAILSRLVRARWRAGFTLAGRLFDDVLTYDPRQGVLASNLRLAALLGAEPQAIEPKLFVSTEDAARANAFLGADRPDRPRLAFATQFSGGYPGKRGWAGERFASVADRLATETGAEILFVGTGAESAAIEQIRAAMRMPSVSTASALNIRALGALLAQCDALVTLDTGSLHVARAVATPAVVIARPWQAPQEWLPLGLPGYTILSKPDLVASSREDPAFPVPDTIDEISVDEVVAALSATLAQDPPAAAARAARLAARLA